MKVTIKKTNTPEPEVWILSEKVDSNIKQLYQYIHNYGQRIRVKKEKDTEHVNVSDIYYLETIDNRTFLYSRADVYEVGMKLYELEEQLDNRDFIRISRSQIMNINHVTKLQQEINRTLQVTLDNSEKLYVSRKYTAELKRILKSAGEGII